MANQQKQQTLAILLALTTWFFVVLQFVLQIVNRNTSVAEAILRFFSYFTILTNILVAVYCTIIALRKPGKRYQFAQQPAVGTAITVYILIVGLVYNLVLRTTWNPQGWQLVADNGLHTLVPLGMLFYWIFYIPHTPFQWNRVHWWLLYPFTYLLYALARGSVSGFYPYFFINVTELGYTAALRNAFFVTLAFLLVILLLVYAGNRFKKSAA